MTRLALHPRAALGTIAVTLTAVALLLYLPWVERPFDVIDFSEFLPLLRAEGGPGARFGGLLDYYVGHHGRLNLVGYAGLFLKWELFGATTATWYWLRIAQLVLLAILVYQVARRLDCDGIGAFAAAALFVVARPASEGWYRLTLGEPLGLLFMLGAMWLATGWRADPSRARGWGIALLVAAAVLTKEMLAGLAPLVLVIGLFRTEEGRLDPRAMAASWRSLVLWVGVPAVLTFGAAAAVAIAATGDGFTTLYGRDPLTFAGFLGLLPRPWQLDSSPLQAWWMVPANVLLFLVLSAGGWAAVRAVAEERRHLAMVAAGAAWASLSFAVLYLPWPWAYYYYAMPFLVGPALLLGAALTLVARHAPRLRWVAYGVTLAMLVAAGASAGREARRTIALQRVHGAVVDQLVARRDADSIFVVRPRLGRFAWIGTAPSLRNFALGSGQVLALPPAEDRTCASMGELLGSRGGRVVIVSYLSACGAFTMTPTFTVRDTVRFLTVGWGTAEVQTEVIGADLIDIRRRPGGETP